jgi:hypothetical protein
MSYYRPFENNSAFKEAFRNILEEAQACAFGRASRKEKIPPPMPLDFYINRKLNEFNEIVNMLQNKPDDTELREKYNRILYSKVWRPVLPGAAKDLLKDSIAGSYIICPTQMSRDPLKILFKDLEGKIQEIPCEDVDQISKYLEQSGLSSAPNLKEDVNL